MRVRIPGAYVAVAAPLVLTLLAVASGCGLSLAGGAAYTLGDVPVVEPDAGGSGGVSINGGGPGSGVTADAGGTLNSPLDSGSSTTADGDTDSAPPVAPPDASPAAPRDDAGGSAADASTPSSGSIDAGPLPTVIGSWSFEEGTGNVSADLSGYGHPAHLFGGAAWAAGKAGSGLALDGVSGYADTGSTLIDTTKSFSVMCWVQLAVVDTWQMAITEADTNGSLFGLKLRGDQTDTFDFDIETSDDLTPGYVVARSLHTAQPGAWVHLVGVYDTNEPGTLRDYVNGALESSVTVGQPLLAATGHFVIGRGLYNDVWGAYVHGTIDEVEVFDGALTDAQVALVYATQD